MSCKDKHKDDCDCYEHKDYDKSSSDYADEYDWMKDCMPKHMPMMYHKPMMKPMVVYHYHYMMKPMAHHHHMMKPMMHGHKMPMMQGPNMPIMQEPNTPMMQEPNMPIMQEPNTPMVPVMGEQLPNPVCPCKTWYQVKPGDSMYKIAQMYNVPLDRLIACNPWIPNPAVIYPGQYICIPYTEPTPGPCKCKEYYTVKPGDSMYKIAQMYNVPLNRLIACNPQIPNPALIYPGQKICIPYTMTQPGPCQCKEYYTVKPGDSMYKIAQMYNIPLNRLIACNPQIPNPALIYPGQKICIPMNANPMMGVEMRMAQHMTPMPEMVIGMTDQACTWYTVKEGDTMYKIAQQYNISLNELIAANPQIPDPSQINPGQKICIPKVEVPSDCKTYHTVKSGDTMYKIAQQYNVSLDALIAANPQISNPSNISPGQKICIPYSNSKPLPDCQEYYIVKPGDSMYKIAQKYDIELDDLIAANPQIDDPSVLYPGQKICIPE